MAIQHQRETLEKLYPVQRDLAIHRHRAAQEMDEIREEARGMLQQLTYVLNVGCEQSQVFTGL